MTQTRWDKLKSVFTAAMALDEADRLAFLDRECAGDVELRREVESLLAAGKPDALVTGDALRAAVAVDSTKFASPSLKPGAWVGRYKLLQLIGEGGFGSVYMAEQEKPVARKVALKIIKLGMDTHQVIARFEAERQALAMMDHPNIARVLDAGATETGRPYFVMDLVKGDPIAEYCDKNNISITDRLELFAQVCTAVQHAHTKGIIHRDIKPSNILVSTQDGRPHAKVIDFGIAKATASKLTEKTLFTEHKQLIGTPQYMSPEQAEGSLDIDTRTDVYSLGVLLYELLTGTTPFTSHELRSAAYGEIQRIIREVEPPKPSTRLSQNTATLASIAAQRHTEPKKLGGIVRGELDWIVMKSLEKDRQRRYETANGLAMDIRRFLTGDAVLAAPPSRAYRLRKFVRRHRGTVLAGTAVVAALLLGMIGTTWGSIEARRHQRIAQVEATNARQAAMAESKARTRAETITAFVTTALKSSDAVNDGGGKDVTVWAAMHNAIKDIDSGRFKDDPETEAALRDTIATILQNNGRYAEAATLYAQALETRRHFLPGDNAVVADSLNHFAVAMLTLGRNTECESAAAQALEMNRRLYKGDNKDVADSLNYLARVRLALGRLPEAEDLFLQSLEMWQRLTTGDNPDVAVCLRDLGEVRLAQGHLADAEKLYIQALEMNQRLHKGDHPAIARATLRVAMVWQGQGRNAEAEPLFVKSLEMQQRLYKGDHPDVADTLRSLANVRQALGHLEESEALSVQALEMCQRLNKTDHVMLARCLHEVGTARMTLNRPADAEPMFTRALEMYQRIYTGDQPLVAECLNDVANVRLTLGNPADAEPLFLKALEMNRQLLKGDHNSIAMNLSNLARTRHAMGKTAESRQGFEEAVAMLRRLTPNGTPLFARVLWRSGVARLDNKDPTALSQLEEAVAMAEKVLPPAHPDLVGYRQHLATHKAALAEKDKQAVHTEDK